MVLLLLALAGCSSEPVAAQPWRDAVNARIRDDMYSFLAEGDVYRAESPDRGLAGRFDAAGVRLVSAGDAVEVRSLRWGRGDRLDAVTADAPRRGACVPGRVDPAGDCVRRLEYPDAGITEWWAAGERGFEQGWTVSAAPGGDGPLVVEAGVSGAAVASAGDGLTLALDGGAEWTVSGVAAWDADGVALAAHVVPAAGGFRVVIADTGARYPVDIDPVWEGSVDSHGALADDYFGSSVAGGGDIDGDGYDDVIVGSDNYNTGTGRVYVFNGTASGMSSTASVTLTGPSAYSYFGWSVAHAGDVNRDGYADVVIGADGVDDFSGEVDVYLGSATGLASPPKTILGAPGVGIDFGYSVAGAGDVDGDGYDDVVVGAGYYSTSTGRAFVYHGSALGTVGAGAVILDGETEGDSFGDAVSGAGDVNGDGYDDVIVGAEGYDFGTGRIYVFHGSAAGVSPTATTVVTGANLGDSFGLAVSDAGDVNGDGYADVIVGAYTYGTSIGQATVYLGSAAGVSGTAATTLTGESARSYFGGAVSGAGDVDGDGYDDVVVGADYADGGRGKVYLYAGSASGVGTTPVTTLTGGTAGDHYGHAVSDAGDVDGDGYDDVIVGANGYGGHAGGVALLLGYVDGDGDGSAATEDCDESDPTIHPGAVEVCDGVDNDCSGVIDDGVDCTAPTEGTFDARPTTDAVTLYWGGFSDAGSGIASYTVVMATGETAPESCAAGEPTYVGSGTTVAVAGLARGSVYSFRLCATDGAGNMSAGLTVTTYPNVDELTPIGSIHVNGDAVWTRSPVVTLTLTATDDRRVTSMCLSNTGVCSTWEPYAPSRPWVLAPPGATRTVYVRYRDAAGNVTAQMSDSIQLDAAPPTDGALIAGGGAGTATLSWSGYADVGSGIVAYTLVEGGGTAPATCAAGTVVYTGLDTRVVEADLAAGMHHYRVCATDAAGNVSRGSTVSVRVR